ncbi:MAG: oxygen-independent coproporphyrinogen III oxidase, partial [Deltaproteobacteria bacterium]|nr:oxygen-independent coproporphyrinogen III oxidase [Deltaproteobacteria bacterium]
MYQIPENLIKKYAVIGPRYTSYPTAPMWKTIDPEIHGKWLEEVKGNDKPKSIYIHIPFCKERCLYCGCNTTVTRKQTDATEYVEFILKELDHLGELQDKKPKLRQLHFGGGTPTYLLDEEFEAIMRKIKSYFEFDSNIEIAIEVDPCSTRPGQLEFLGSLGFNRISLGVQDLNEKVQIAVNRVQSAEITFEHLKKAKELGFKGVNFDLIYGLPYQTLDSFKQTLKQVIEMKPDRLALYNFAHLPKQIPHQRKIKPETLPCEKEKLAILFHAINDFTEAGYNYIGMDHFALKEDELSLAQNDRTLYRNFMGYSPKSGVDLIGIGASSISEFDDYFIQNEKDIGIYANNIDRLKLAGSKGLNLSQDDKIRKWTIIKLICHFYLSFSEFERQFGIPFKTYFETELIELEKLEKDRLVEV